MDPTRIFSKTGKGTRTAAAKRKELSANAYKVLQLIDNKTESGSILSQIGKMSEVDFNIAIAQLENGGYIRAMQKDDWELGDEHYNSPSSGMVVEEIDPDAFLDSAGQAKVEQHAREAEEEQFMIAAEALAQVEKTAREQAERETRAETERQAQAAAEARQRSEAEARAQAAETARLKAERQAQQEAQRQEEARRREEVARMQAENEARRSAERQAQEAAERAAREAAEQQLRKEEEARRLVDEAVRLAVERRAREDAERQAQAENEARAKAEAEARARAEEAARLEAEHVAREAAAKQEAERLEREEAERAAHAAAKQRKREEEAAQRAEAEAERQRLAEEARLKAEAKAREEAEKTAQREAERLAREEAKRKEQEEKEARRKAEEARKAQEEAERQAKKAEEARLKAEAKARAEAEKAAQREAERLAREQEERKAREEQEARRQAEDARKAQEAAERAARQAEEARIQAAEEARAQAEKAVKMEADRIARETAERKAAAEKEAKRQADEARQAQEAAAREVRLAEETRRKAEAAETKRQAQETARAQAEEEKQLKAERKAREQAERRAAKFAKTRAKRDTAEPGKLAAQAKTAALALGVALALVVAVLHFVNLGFMAGPLEQLVSTSIGEPVKIGGIRAALFPTPRVNLSEITVGTQSDVRIGSAHAALDLTQLFDERKSLRSLEITDMALDASVLSRAQHWIAASAQSGRLTVRRIQLKNITPQIAGLTLPAFDGQITPTASGEIAASEFSSADHSLTLRFTPQGTQQQVEVEASNWQPPLGTAPQFSDLQAQGVIIGKQVRFDRIEGHLYGGKFNAKGIADWAAGATMSGSFELDGVSLAQALAGLGASPSAEGALNAVGTFASRAPVAGKLADTAEVHATFKASEGKINGIDLASAAISGTRNNMTRFDTLTGEVQFRGGIYHYRKLALDAGQFHARGDLDVQANQQIAGNINTELAIPSRHMQSQLRLGGKVGDVWIK